MATREENLKKINAELEKLSDEELEKVAGGALIVLEQVAGGNLGIYSVEQQNSFQNNGFDGKAINWLPKR